MSENKFTLAKWAAAISPFYVTATMAQAKQLEAQGRDVIHLEVGEPDFTTPQLIVDVGIAALRSGKTHYTAALGLAELRQAIADWYKYTYQVIVSANRVVITP